jgi:hypothetical protein
MYCKLFAGKLFRDAANVCAYCGSPRIRRNRPQAPGPAAYATDHRRSLCRCCRYFDIDVTVVRLGMAVSVNHDRDWAAALLSDR